MFIYFKRYFVLFLFISVVCELIPGLGAVDFSKIKCGAERTEIYLPLIKGKRIAIVANQTSMIGNRHLVDSLKSLNVNIRVIFSPEHGFRGESEAGAGIESYFDAKSGLNVISLYGKNKKPKAADLKDIDIVIFDIQDVGVRFYTYISTLHYIMEACAENNVELLILDRPNPNGFYVDGPVLQAKYKSFVGMHPVPVVHGMTIAEYAEMINGEGWLNNKIKCRLKYILCENYSHKMFYKLPVRPSPNLPDMNSVFLYPSLGFFEGTAVSVGRGTGFPFRVIGYPEFNNPDFTFTPKSIKGISEHPLYENVLCKGYDLTDSAEKNIIEKKQLNLNWLVEMYNKYPKRDKFFADFFNLLAGSGELQRQIKKGVKIENIRKSWDKDLDKFRKTRKKYLLYEDY
jgi:uncharacterized protein YbbC (DUF1343 family)